MLNKNDNELLPQLQQLRQQVMFIEKTAKLGYWELDISHKKMYWSPQMYQIFGLQTASGGNRNFIRNHLCIEDIAAYKEALRELLSGAQYVEKELRIRNIDGILLYCKFQAGYKIENGRKFIVGILQDISEQVKFRQNLEQAKTLAEDMNREKSRFYAKISHDLRQPLQALKIFISLLREEDLSKHQAELAQKIQSAADNMGVWLDNLLESAKIESGGILRRDVPFRLDVLLSALGQEYQDVAADKKIDLSFTGSKICVTADNILLERIIRNLLNNAIKYCRKRIYMRWYCRGSEGVRIVVKDDGIGLSGIVRENLFQSFYQNPKHRRLGSGLGLSIVKELSDILGIEIKVYTKENKGTIFVLTLPKKDSESHQENKR